MTADASLPQPGPAPKAPRPLRWTTRVLVALGRGDDPRQGQGHVPPAAGLFPRAAPARSVGQSMTSRRWRGLHRSIDRRRRGGSDTRARVHEPRRCDRRADVDVRLRLPPKMGEAIGAVTDRSCGILLGRTTYEMFEPAWSTRTVEDDPARSSTTPPSTSSPRRSRLRRGGTRRSSGHDAGAIRGLKEEVDGDLYVSGSGTLVRAMLADGLVEELHLFVYPLTRGPRSAALPRGSRAGQPVACGL